MRKILTRYGKIIKNYLERSNNYAIDSSDFKKEVLTGIYQGIFSNEDLKTTYKNYPKINEDECFLPLLNTTSNKKNQLWLEFELEDTRLLPVIVSGHDVPVLWIDKHKNKSVRAGFLKSEEISIADFMHLALEEIIYYGLEYEWGNIHELSEEGFKLAKEHLKEYEYENLILFKNKNYNIDFEVSIDKVVDVDWLLEDYLLLIPTDKEQLGKMVIIDNIYCALIANPSRAMAICVKL